MQKVVDEPITTSKEFCEKWDLQAFRSQSASNPSGLLHAACEMLSDWRQIGGDFQGKDCSQLKFLLFQTVYLIFGKELEWNERHAEWEQMSARDLERETEFVDIMFADRTENSQLP